MVNRSNAGVKNLAAASGASEVPGADIDRYGTGVAGFPAPHPSTRVISPYPDIDEAMHEATTADPENPRSGWRVVLMLGWVGGILGYSTIWAVSRQIGLPTWWLGPRSTPSPIPVMSLPFLAPVLVLIGIAMNLQRIALYSFLAAIVTLGIAAGDANTQPGLALAQVAISIGLLSTSLAALIGGGARQGRSHMTAKPPKAR